MSFEPALKLGATYGRDGVCEFLVWAPRVERLDLHLISPFDRTVAMQREEKGYFRTQLRNLDPATLYFYRLNNKEERPDPASRFQPRGVYGPSQVVDPRFDWNDASWRGIELSNYVIYELHVGTFTAEGTFAAIIQRLALLKDVGFTAIELMPVAQFPGSRNWGYDGVFPFAVQDSYGGPSGLKRLVDACHSAGLAVVLDVVYNHLGPEGNYLSQFGPYFSDFHRTPWGAAINVDQSHSDEVRRFLIENALYWISEFHVDALRLDAVHAIMDTSANPFLAELAVAVHAEAQRLQRRVYLIPESNQNDARLVRSTPLCGYDLGAQWNNDFHHALHALLTGEDNGYYADFGTTEHLARAFREGFVFSGQYSVYRGRRHGNSSSELPAERLVVFAQNHDQVGNRRLGDRLGSLVSFEALKLAAGLVSLSPYIPLFLMGEEYGETSPFQYFVSHGNPTLIEAVRKGRREEFSRFAWQGEMPDPQDEATFLRSRLIWELRDKSPHKNLLALYKELLRLRREDPVLSRRDNKNLEACSFERPKALLLRRWHGAHEILALFSFEREQVSLSCPVPAGRWAMLLDSANQDWGGQGSGIPSVLETSGQVTILLPAWSFFVFKRVAETE
ncbi:MAG TPA: malto-oligosyltrehalose trehalohydrolase [Candidatus Acidoferrum sp.]|nr:malto-oligosyltrehalose trehalohydrolase [Candidatus Acidoferrum sp.]